jgi:hypothetical protein
MINTFINNLGKSKVDANKMRERKKSKRPREDDLNFLVKSEDYTV